MSTRKSKEQIKRFLSGVKLSSEVDEFRIRKFVGHRKAKVPYNFGDSGYDPAAGLTFEQFEHWHNAATPDAGEVIQCLKGGAVGIVVREGWNSFVLGVTLTPDGSLSLEELTIDHQEWAPATHGQTTLLQRALSAGGYDWDPSKLRPIARVIPSVPRFVRLMVVGKQVGIGVFKEISPAGTLEMFCVKMSDEPLRCEGNINLGDADNFSFSGTYAEHRAIVQDELAGHGLIWNAKCCRLQRNRARAEQGKPYFWITSYLEIRLSADNYSAADNKRFRRGNYFLSREVVETVRNGWIDLAREEMVSEKNK